MGQMVQTFELEFGEAMGLNVERFDDLPDRPKYDGEMMTHATSIPKVPTTAAEVNALPDTTKYAANIVASMDNTNYVLTMTLKDQNGNTIGSTQSVDLPLESVVVSGSYDSQTKSIVLTLQNGDTVTFSVADLVAGLQSEITAQNKLSADLVTDTNAVNKFVTASDKTTWNGKQNALTAGDNISLSGNTISATDTTYSDFVGTDGQTAGVAGLVPAPATTDADKYLKSDGSWATVNAGPTVVQTTGTSTTDVMSQNAVTSMVFADPATQYKIKIGAGTFASEGNDGIEIGHEASAAGTNGIALGYQSTVANIVNAMALGRSATAAARGSIALGSNSGTNIHAAGTMDISTTNTADGYNNSNYRLLTGLYDPQSAHDAATKGYVDGTTETYTIATTDWTALANSAPYTYQATVTATYTVGANTIAELLNDNPVEFATYGFAIGDITGQTVTIYSIEQPSASETLKINYKG